MIMAKLRVEYKDLSPLELVNQVYDLAFTFEKYSGSCSQSVVAAIHKVLEIDDAVVRVASSSAGGQFAQVSGTCGGLIGATIVLDYFLGRPAGKMSHEEGVSGNVDLHLDAIKTATPLFYRYINEYGTILCPQIQTKLFGRPYYLLDEDEMRKFEEAGGHENKCPDVVGKAARWAMEILLEKGVVGQ